MRSIEEIVALYTHRQRTLGPVHQQMQAVRELGNGDIVVPLNELDKNARASVANLLVQGLDQMSMRVASTMPTCYFPPMKEGGGSSGPNRSGRGSGRTTQRSRATYSVTSNNSDGTRGKKTYRQHSMFNRYQPTAARIRKSTRNLGPRPNR